MTTGAGAATGQATHGAASSAPHLRALELVLGHSTPNIVEQFTRACAVIVVFASAMDWPVLRLALVIALNVVVAVTAIGLRWMGRTLFRDAKNA